MASHGHPMAPTAPRPHQPVVYGAPIPSHVATAPAGTFAPGTKIQVGSHRVVIQKYLSEGGFAHVYLVKLPKPLDGTDLAVLKRVAVPDKEALKGMRTEVETMKRLKGHHPIVTYIDSHASELHGGGYEVFLLMEYCNGGGLIDFMNTRLQHRLTEPEILQIFTDVAEGVACMHYLKPPLLHRDLKVENVLISTQDSKRRFKLCDFGSTAPPRPAPQTVAECRLVDEDVQKHTTLQYRSPEMVDVYRKQPIDEKSDIWALGVLLYKLCYYTTPFEDQGQLAILNASYRFHSHPVFSDRLKKLIASLLRENPQSRPNIYQVLREACAMQGREVPIPDIYSGRTYQEIRSSEKPHATEKLNSSAVVGAVFAPPRKEQQTIPDIVPMRRGRPPSTAHQATQQPQKPTPVSVRVTSGDPFAALDSKSAGQGETAAGPSSRFPSLEQFSLLHDHGSKFSFDSPTSPPLKQQDDLNQKVAQHLADEAFAKPQSTLSTSPIPSRPRTVAPTDATTHLPLNVKPAPSATDLKKTLSAPPKTAEMSRASAIITSNPELQAISNHSTQNYVSTGTMTTPPPEEKPREAMPPPIWRVPSPDRQRATSAPRPGMEEPNLPNIPRFEENQPASNPRNMSSQYPSSHKRQPSSSRPSLEGARPSAESVGRQRPASTHLESSIDYLRERQMTSKPMGSSGFPLARYTDKTPSPAAGPEDEINIESNVEFLRSLEETGGKKDRSSWHVKRPSTSLSTGSKNILTGKFGEAFKRFESHQPPPAASRTPSPDKEFDRRDLTPIAGSEATDGRSDDGQTQAHDENMSPEMRREFERQQLIQEERRVEAAQAEYRQRMATRAPILSARPALPPKPVSKAISIQHRVQSLLDDGQKSDQVPRTAEGYGVYSDAATAASRVEKPQPTTSRKAINRPVIPPSNMQDVGAIKPSQPAADPPQTTPRLAQGAKPPAPKKPVHLNNLPTVGATAPYPRQAQYGTEHLVALELSGQPLLDMTAQEKNDYIENFSKRFPSLSSLEMVERDIDAEVEDRPRR
ncbi:serine/threonine-protein kinase ppk30 [Sodiomyces alkalinus F11]|uniref:non-specific serine/threonine protein kinase n=1 Tax=Sodiomyces alkalinus (strain CBS 110278 / VKM F-3762 / F11) TaxID=1314773 RepID=A0A3N2Q7P3_SODAK|nr:serine/threonine-protein kinase ppk30 [Sodiomyces alkalinus F11]ROT42799.1 serine/threonine-protein kinase ppk30 [Sodiomyces alkalinus F11]